MTSIDLLDTLRSTGSVRGFSDAPVASETVHAILDAARFAPSGGNAQGWGVIQVDDVAVRGELGRLSQKTWDEYAAQRAAGRRPFAADDSGRWPGLGDLAETEFPHSPNPLIEELERVPVVLVVTADLGAIAAMDTDLDRVQFCGGASVHPFCWSVLLAARAYGLGGVLTTFLVRQELEVRPLLGLGPREAVAAMICLGVPTHQNTKLTRKPVDSFLRFV